MGDRAGNGNGEYRFTIPVLPPSVNSLHQIIYSKRRVELRPEVVKWKNDAYPFIPRIVLASATSLVEIDATFHYSLTYNNGKVRRRDTMNFLKVMIDLIAQRAGFDDCRVRKGSWNSVDSRDEKVEVTLREVEG